jgi:hypothetical protein
VKQIRYVGDLMTTIQIIDRSDMVSKLKQNLVIDPAGTAFIAIDMHRGNLDPAVVLNTAFSAFNRDFQVIVISDCVASMYGDDLHVLGLENVKRCLGHVLTVDEFMEKMPM